MEPRGSISLGEFLHWGNSGVDRYRQLTRLDAMNNYTEDFARAFNSPIRHLIAKGTRFTRCGLDAKLMARWSADNAGADARNWRRCEKCH